MPSTIGLWTDKPLARRWGDVVSTTELSDADLDKLVLRAESELADVLNKDDWSATDRSYPAVQEAATLLTAAKVIRSVYSDDDHLSKAGKFRREAMEIAQNVNKGAGVSGDSAAVLFASSDYVTRGLYRGQNPGSEVIPHYLSDY